MTGRTRLDPRRAQAKRLTVRLDPETERALRSYARRERIGLAEAARRKIRGDAGNRRR